MKILRRPLFWMMIAFGLFLLVAATTGFPCDVIRLRYSNAEGTSKAVVWIYLKLDVPGLFKGRFADFIERNVEEISVERRGVKWHTKDEDLQRCGNFDRSECSLDEHGLRFGGANSTNEPWSAVIALPDSSPNTKMYYDYHYDGEELDVEWTRD